MYIDLFGHRRAFGFSVIVFNQVSTFFANMCQLKLCLGELICTIIWSLLLIYLFILICILQ